MKTVIVGNGIVGLTSALRLTQRGGEVALVGDPARPGSATLAAAAMLNSFAELVPASLATELDRMRFELSRSATERWRALGEELGGLAALDPRRVVAALERALAAAPHVELIAGTAERLRASDRAITGVVLADGRVVTGTHYLVANGASVSALLDRSALGLAVQRVAYGIGTTLELRAPAAHVACLRGHGVYSVPRGDRVVVGSTNLVADAPVDDPTAAARILAAAIARLDARFEHAELLRANVGWRPIGQDPYPLIGRTAIENLAIATGTRRDGFHLAPVIADHLAALLHDAPGDPRFAAFGPERPVRSLPSMR